MKKTVFILCLLIFTAFLSAQSNRNIRYIAVQTLDLKEGTGFFASTTGTLNYGDEVTLIGTRNDWSHISSIANPSISGWVKTTSLTNRRILQGDTTSASAREVALAGRGLAQESSGSNTRAGEPNFAAVDRVESINISRDELQRFIIQGGLSLGSL